MQRKNTKTVVALCAAVPVIAIAAFVITKAGNEDAPGLYVSDSTASAVQAENDNRNGGKTDNKDNNDDPAGKDIEDPTKDKASNGGSADNSEEGSDKGASGESGNSADKPSGNDGADPSNENGGGKTDSKAASSDGKKDTSEKDSSSSAGKASDSKASDKTSSAADKTTSKAADKTSSGASTESTPDPIPAEDVKYTFKALDKMVDGNFRIATSGHINYMVNANVSGEADYNGSDTHIKVESADFPAVNSDTYTQGGALYRVINPANSTYSRNASIVNSFIDFGRVFESFAANRDALIPLECTTEGGVTTEKFSYTYYDSLCYYDDLTLIITIQYDGSGMPFSLHVTTNEDYGYEEIYQSDSLSFYESIGGVDVPDFSGWTCVDDTAPTA